MFHNLNNQEHKYFTTLILLIKSGAHPDPHWGQAVPVRVLSQAVLPQRQLLVPHDVEEMPTTGNFGEDRGSSNSC